MDNQMDKDYSKYLNNIVILSEDEIKENFRKFYKTHKEEYFNNIFNSLQKLAVKYAYDKLDECKGLATIDFMDIVQEGLMRLVEYIRKETYNPDKNVSPSTYFMLMLNCKVGGMVYHNTYPVRLNSTDFHKIVKNYKARQELKEGSTSRKVKRKYGIDQKELDIERTLPSSISIYNETNDEEGHTTYAIDKMIFDENPTEDLLFRTQFYEKLQELLPEEDYNILKMKFIDGYKTEEISQKLNLSSRDINKSIGRSKIIIKENYNTLRELIS